LTACGYGINRIFGEEAVMAEIVQEPGQPAAAAKRGDLVVAEEHHRDYVLHGENREYDTFTVGVVTSVTRDGQVKMFRRAGNFDQGKDWRGQPDRGENIPSGMVRSYLVSSSDIDVAGALATAACHVWVTGKGSHEDSARPYGELAEVRDWLKPHRKTGWTWNLLRDAAVAWEKARREAAPMLTDALRYHGEEFMAKSAAYHAAVAAANEAYRAVYAGVVSGEITSQ
jgi:hypothetical protein